MWCSRKLQLFCTWSSKLSRVSIQVGPRLLIRDSSLPFTPWNSFHRKSFHLASCWKNKESWFREYNWIYKSQSPFLSGEVLWKSLSLPTRQWAQFIDSNSPNSLYRRSSSSPSLPLLSSSYPWYGALTRFYHPHWANKTFLKQLLFLYYWLLCSGL